KKLRAKHRLERLDLMAKRRRRNIELLGRAREMQLFRDGHEIPKMAQFHRLKCHLLERCWRKLLKFNRFPVLNSENFPGQREEVRNGRLPNQYRGYFKSFPSSSAGPASGRMGSLRIAVSLPFSSTISRPRTSRRIQPLCSWPVFSLNSVFAE